MSRLHTSKFDRAQSEAFQSVALFLRPTVGIRFIYSALLLFSILDTSSFNLSE